MKTIKLRYLEEQYESGYLASYYKEKSELMFDMEKEKHIIEKIEQKIEFIKEWYDGEMAKTLFGIYLSGLVDANAISIFDSFTFQESIEWN